MCSKICLAFGLVGDRACMTFTGSFFLLLEPRLEPITDGESPYDLHSFFLLLEPILEPVTDGEIEQI